MEVISLERNCLRIVIVPVDQKEVLLPIGYVVIVVALRSKALIAWEGAGVVRLLNDKIGVAVLQVLVVSVVQRHWILVVDVEVR